MPKAHTIADIHKFFLIGDACWLWTGTRKQDERTKELTYPRMYINDRAYPAHRLMYQFCYGPIPRGLHVLHKCDTPHCVRPGHLFLGTHKENMQDMARKFRGAHRFTREQILAIRADQRPQKEIAKSYGCAQGNVSVIKSRKAYGYVE